MTTYGGLRKVTDPVLVYTLFGFKLSTVEEVDLPETGLSKYRLHDEDVQQMLC